MGLAKKFVVVGSVVLLLASVMVRSSASGRAATRFRVKTTVDEINANGLCSLREAVINANEDSQSGSTDCPAGSGPDVILLPPGRGVYEISIDGQDEDEARQGDLDILDPVTIRTEGARARAIIDGNDLDRIFDVVEGETTALFRVAMHRLTVTGGSGERGGAIQNAQELRVSKSVFVDNEGRSGGAIYNGSNSPLVLNKVRFGLPGRGNSATDGGAVLNEGMLTIRRSVFEGNDVTDDGGGLFSGGGSHTVATETRFLSNVAGEDGGAIFLGGTGASTARLKAVQVGLPGKGNVGALGGGIYAVGNHELHVLGSSFVGNDAPDEGGAIWSSAKVFLVNTTISGNRTDGLGGGIYNELGGDVTGTGVTLTDNLGHTSGNVWDESGDTGHSVRFAMSIIVDGSPDNCSGEDWRYEDLGFNLTDETGPTACNLSAATGSLVGVDADLGRLGLYGGSTLVHSLPRGSAAVDAIDARFCPPPKRDQRGAKRPLPGRRNRKARCDIGAFERNVRKRRTRSNL